MMMHAWRKVVASLLSVVLLIGGVPFSAFADEVQSTEGAPSYWIEVDNPLTGGSGELVEIELQDAPSLLSDAEPTYLAYDEAVSVLVEGMAARQETISVSLETDADYASQAFAMFADALEEDGNPLHGDYLRWHWDSMGCALSGTRSGDVYYITFSYSITYKTTADQDAELLAAVKGAIEGMGLGGKSDYCKAKAIYDYICESVEYDNAHVGDSSYRRQYTAYAAFFDKTSVCQGYATLFYLMASEAGLPCRVIAGSGNGGDHSWNIVKIGSSFYNLDATWDAGRTDYSYFLKSDADFDKHVRGASGPIKDKDGNVVGYMLEYDSDEFTTAYPMAEVSYDPDSPFDDGGEGETFIEVVAPSAKSGLVYNGSAQTGVAAGVGYTLSGTLSATNAGTYKATATLAEGYVWSDGTDDAKVIEWSIAAKKVAVPTGKALTYSGSAQTGVSAGEGYALSGTTAATLVGSYSATATLKTNYAWSDGSTEPKAVAWSIAKNESLGSYRQFKDVAAGDWYVKDGWVDYVIQAGLMNGTSASSFEPGGTVTRAQVALILYRMAGSPSNLGGKTPFTDDSGHWATDAIRWCYSNGVVNGTSATTFDPGAPVTREQLATMIYRYCVDYAKMASASASITGAPDANMVSSYAEAGIKFCFAHGIMGGDDKGYINPKGSAQRSELAKMITVTHRDVID